MYAPPPPLPLNSKKKKEKKSRYTLSFGPPSHNEFVKKITPFPSLASPQ
jgi:hypothetical protein